MIDDYINPIILLQIKSAFIFFLNISMLGVFVSILLNDRVNRSMPYYKALMFVAIYFFGMGIEQFWYWVWRHYAHGSRTWLTDFPLIVLLILNCVVVVGCIGIIRYFTLDRYGRWLWILLTIVCLLLAMTTPMLPRTLN